MSENPGPIYNVPLDHDCFAVLMNRLNKRIFLHLVDREGGNLSVEPLKIPVAENMKRFGNATDIYFVEPEDAKDIQHKGNEVTFSLKPSLSSTIVLKFLAGNRMPAGGDKGFLVRNV